MKTRFENMIPASHIPMRNHFSGVPVLRCCRFRSLGCGGNFNAGPAFSFLP